MLLLAVGMLYYHISLNLFILYDNQLYVAVYTGTLYCFLCSLSDSKSDELNWDKMDPQGQLPSAREGHALM